MRRVSVYLESEDSEALEVIAREAGCVVGRGRHKGRGSISRLLRRIARQGKEFQEFLTGEWSPPPKTRDFQGFGAGLHDQDSIEVAKGRRGMDEERIKVLLGEVKDIALAFGLLMRRLNKCLRFLGENGEGERHG